jgi:hypothetical protein
VVSPPCSPSVLPLARVVGKSTFHLFFCRIADVVWFADVLRTINRKQK